MAITNKDKNTGRQWPLSARQPFDFSQMVSGTAVPAIDLPVGAIVLAGSMVISEVFNSATSDTIAVSGGGASVAATSVAALGRTALVVDGVEQALSTTVDLTWTGAGAVPTTGRGYVEVQYIITSRANENQ